MLAIICIRPRGACFKGQLSAPLLRRWRESPARMTLSLSRKKKKKNGIFRSFLLSLVRRWILGRGSRKGGGERERERERGDERRGAKPRAIPGSEIRNKISVYLGAVNGVVNDATSPLPFSLSPDSVAAVTLSLSLAWPLPLLFYCR